MENICEAILCFDSEELFVEVGVQWPKIHILWEAWGGMGNTCTYHTEL